MHEEILGVIDLFISLTRLSESKRLTIDCFYFSDQEVKMEEAMSHTGIHQFLFSFSGFSLTPAWAELPHFH